MDQYCIIYNIYTDKYSTQTCTMRKKRLKVMLLFTGEIVYKYCEYMCIGVLERVLDFFCFAMPLAYFFVVYIHIHHLHLHINIIIIIYDDNNDMYVPIYNHIHE